MDPLFPFGLAQDNSVGDMADIRPHCHFFAFHLPFNMI
jgi:hypothetical protein